MSSENVIFFVFGIFKPGQVHLDKGYLYQNTTFVFVFGKGHIGPSSLEQRMSSENVIFSLFLEFSNRAKFTRRIEIDTKILPTDWKLTFSFVTSRDCVISAKLVCSNSKLIKFLAAISQKLIVQDARQIRQGWTLKGQFFSEIWHFCVIFE